MAEWIEGVKCVHQITCGVLLSLLLSLAIRSHINMASDSCDSSGQRMDGGNSKCEMNSDRYWTLGIFYSGAAIFAFGTIATCTSNGYMVIGYLLCAAVWLAAIAGLSIYRMSSRDKVFIDAFYTITEEVILDKWKLWSTILQWVVAIGVIVTLSCGAVMTFHFLHYKYV